MERQTIDAQLLLRQIMIDHRRPSRTGKGHQAALIDVVIREVNQGLVAAAVMPVQIAGAYEWDHHVQQTLEPVGSPGFLVIPEFFFFARGEECSWRQLLAVACDHNFIAAQNRRNSVLRQNLAGLIEDDEIEISSAAIELLTYRERTSHPARANRRQDLGGLTE